MLKRFNAIFTLSVLLICGLALFLMNRSGAAFAPAVSHTSGSGEASVSVIRNSASYFSDLPKALCPEEDSSAGIGLTEEMNEAFDGMASRFFSAAVIFFTLCLFHRLIYRRIFFDSAIIPYRSLSVIMGFELRADGKKDPLAVILSLRR